MWKKKVGCAFLKFLINIEKNSGISEVKNYTIRNAVFVSGLHKYLSKT